MTLSAADILGEASIPELIEAIHPVTPASVRVREAPAMMRLVWGANTAAITLGRRIFVDPTILKAGGRRLSGLLVHELVHSQQWLAGWRFLSRYLGQYFLARMRGARHEVAYSSIGAEVEARRVASEIRKLLDH